MSGPVGQAFGADIVMDNTSSQTTISAGDNVTVPDHAGPDGNTTAGWLDANGDDISVNISGTLQGGTDLLKSIANIDNLSITITSTGEAVSSGNRAFDIDGSGRTVTNLSFENAGDVYTSDGFTVSAQNIQNGEITNEATGTISGARLAILVNGSSDSTLTNAGTIAVNNDNITYRDNLTLSRNAHTDGRAIWAETADNLTITNSGTISSITKETMYLVRTTNSDVTNTGTISATTNQALKLEEAENFTLSNSGTITADTNTIYGDELENSVLTNNDNGTIYADDDFVVYLQYADNASIVNNGTIQSDNGSVFDTNNAVTATITNTGTIKTTSETTDYILSGDNTAFTNAADGTITSTTDGLLLDSGNLFANYGNFTIADNKTAISITGNNNNIRFYDNSTYNGLIDGGSGTGNLLTIETDDGFSLSDNITGAIALTKTGDGVLNITGAQDYTGATTVSDGTLKINGNSTGTTITIGAGGTLGGSGTAGGIVNNGTLAPGNSIGTLNVTGDVTLNDNSTLDIEIGKDGSSDKIILTGALTVDGTLKLIPETGLKYKKVETYEILESGTRTGTFDAISMRACGATIDTSYNADGVTVTVTGCNADRGKTVDQLQNYLHSFYDENPSADISAVLTALEGLSGDEYQKAITTLDADAPLAIARSTTQGIQTVNGFMAQRASAQSGSGSAQRLRMMTASDPLSAESKLSIKKRMAEHSRKGMWLKAYGGSGEKDPIKDIGVNGYDYDFQGTTIGFDLETSKIKQAIALSVQTGSVTSNNKEGYQDYETVLLNYQSTRALKHGGSLALSAGFGVSEIDAKRYIDVGAVDDTATADYRSYSVDLGIAYTFAPIRLGWLTNDLTLSLAGNYNAQESYKEKGAGGLNLEVAPKHSMVGRVGIKNTMFIEDTSDKGAKFMPFLSTGIFGSRHLTNTAVKQGFIGAEQVKVVTDRDMEAYGEFGLGFLRIEEDDDELRFMAKAKISDKVEEYTASLDYGIKF